MPNELSQDLESELSSSKTQILDSKKNLESCESKLNEQTESEKDECAGIIQSATKSGATKSGVPQYGPTRGDSCLSPGGDDTGKYTMQHSEESENRIMAECEKSPGNVLDLLLILTVYSKQLKDLDRNFILDCDIIVKFTKPKLLGPLGLIEHTYYEMGSTQSRPCFYKSSEVTAMEVVYKKKGSDFRPNQVPAYGPVGTNNCLGWSERPYERYSMKRYYESLSVAKKCCNIYQNCDIIVEVDQSQGRYIYDM